MWPDRRCGARHRIAHLHHPRYRPRRSTRHVRRHTRPAPPPAELRRHRVRRAPGPARQRAGFTAVLAYADGHPVGYAYANTIEHGDRYWPRASSMPAEKYTERPAVALNEIGVRPTWRKTGTARRIHDALLATRNEPYVTLMVNPAAGDGKVHALYKSWGYEDIGQSQPSPASPVLTVMIRAIR
ncbi:GNAT family N-acetyltransferase [Streptomyces albidoflavus]|nr:GNAT family N-acetyltransferase [Streptomyces albidoflavus]MBV7711834.1 GNAT family N-acetyltransferase [Streptomyces albidoflavus]